MAVANKSVLAGDQIKYDMLPYPPFTPLEGREPGSFAMDTITKRLPAIMGNVIADLLSLSQQLSNSQGAAAAIAAATEQVVQMQQAMPLDQAVDPLVPETENDTLLQIVHCTNSCLQAWASRSSSCTWLGFPWLLVECYMYVKLAVIMNGQSYLRDQNYDPFFVQKVAAFDKGVSSVIAIASAVRPILDAAAATSLGDQKAQLFEVVQYSLWGNKTDLSMLVDVSKVDGDVAPPRTSAGDPYLIVDEFEALWQRVSSPDWSGMDRRVDIVLDNAGAELYADLVLADWLVSTSAARHVVLHGKALPWFVSDTLRADLDHMVATCTQHTHPDVRWLGQRWAGHLSAGRWSFSAHAFWTTPCPMCWMADVAPALHAELASASSLLVFKGDLNYRKLTFDCRWPPATPFREALQGFLPTALLSLRTLKADVVAGLKEGQAAQLDKVDPAWLVNGKFGMVQYVEP